MEEKFLSLPGTATVGNRVMSPLLQVCLAKPTSELVEATGQAQELGVQYTTYQPSFHSTVTSSCSSDRGALDVSNLAQT